MSVLMMTYELPFSAKVQLPLYEPMPACGRKNSDLKYELINEVPDWVTFDEQKRVVEISTDDDKSLYGSNVPI